jgi:hypothetical protein
MYLAGALSYTGVMEHRSLAVTLSLGLLLTGCGICKFCQKLAEGEPEADVDNPKTIEREGFTLQYPGNWSVDENASDYDPDHAFTIESQNCMTMFWVEDGSVDPQARAEEKKLAADLLLTDPSTSETRSWGSYEGAGYVIEGRLMGFPATVKVFSHGGERRSFTIMEQCYDEDMPLAGPGLELMRETFELRD